MIRIGTMAAMITKSENNPGGKFYVAKFVLTGKNGKSASEEVRWLMKNGKIVGTSIKVSAGKGFGELLSILSAFQEEIENRGKTNNE